MSPRIRFSLSPLKEKDVEKEVEKVESMNNIMATDEYHLKINAKAEDTIEEDGTQHIKVKYSAECTK